MIGGIGVFCAGALGTIAVAQLMVLGKRLDRLSPVQPTAPAKLSLSPADRHYLRRLGILAWVAGALSVTALLGGGLLMYLVTERQSQAVQSAASAAEIRQLMANMVAGLGLAAIPVFLALAFLVLSLLARLAQQTRLASLGTESGT